MVLAVVTMIRGTSSASPWKGAPCPNCVAEIQPRPGLRTERPSELQCRNMDTGFDDYAIPLPEPREGAPAADFGSTRVCRREHTEPGPKPRSIPASSTHQL